MSENEKKLKEMNQNSPLFFVLKTVTELEKKVDELSKCVLAIAKGLPSK